MPRPRKNEKRKDFITRAIKVFRREGIRGKEAIAKAYGFWRTYKK